MQEGEPVIGSSPLARGLPERPEDDAYRRRIIPARAGFTTPRRRLTSMMRDHPRSRGVYFCLRRRVAHVTGSSPLARGLPDKRRTSLATVGIIPARAGFTMCSGSPFAIIADHPRSRGVYVLSRWGLGMRLGSSPLARGLQSITAQLASNNGIIPARAGFTTPVFNRLLHGGGDHPRSRGVYH